MFKIKYIQERKSYQINSSQFGIFEGNLEDITFKALGIGITNEELTFAYETMNKNKDTIAEFGVNGCFLFSKKAA